MPDPDLTTVFEGDPPDAASEALTLFLYQVPVGLVQATIDGTVEMANPKAAQLLMPLARDADLGNLFTLLDPHAPELRTMVRAFTAASGVVCEAHRVAVSVGLGREPRVLTVGLTRLDAHRLMAVIADATAESEREAAEIARRLRQAARIDTLTAMPNRTALLERVQTVLEREPIDPGYEFALLHVNCDRFKQINDSFGHRAGDEVLALIAGRLSNALRPTDRVGRAGDGPGAAPRMAARIGGDEFVVLLEELRHPGDVHLVASRLLEVLDAPYLVDGRAMHCSVSIGIVTRGDAIADAERLLQDASIAMDEAKRLGGARYVPFAASLRERAARRGGIEAELRVAIEARQLFVVYQPVVDFRDASGEAMDCGVEALVRWAHPTRGVVPPADFIEVAETTGLIGALGAIVLEEACRAFMTWHDEPGLRAPRTLAVNVSRAQLGDASFVGLVSRVLRATGLPPGSLQLEITESLAAQNEVVQSRLHELKALGVRLALDDFGTGYSSLSSLHLLPVDTVKIDRSFVALADTSEHHRALIEATIHVARSLGMQTVAEGVETDAQSAVLRTLGCDKGQGYLFGRPLHGHDLLQRLRRCSPDRAAVA